MTSDVINITLFGPATSTLEYISQSLSQVLEKAELKYSFQHKSQLKDYLENNLSSVPAIQVENKPVFYFGKGNYLHSDIRKAIKQMLIPYDFGKLSRIVVPLINNSFSIQSLHFVQRLANQFDWLTHFHHFNGAGHQKISSIPSDGVDGHHHALRLEKDNEVLLNPSSILFNRWSLTKTDEQGTSYFESDQVKGIAMTLQSIYQYRDFTQQFIKIRKPVIIVPSLMPYKQINKIQWHNDKGMIAQSLMESTQKMFGQKMGMNPFQDSNFDSLFDPKIGSKYEQWGILHAYSKSTFCDILGLNDDKIKRMNKENLNFPLLLI